MSIRLSQKLAEKETLTLPELEFIAFAAGQQHGDALAVTRPDLKRVAYLRDIFTAAEQQLIQADLGGL